MDLFFILTKLILIVIIFAISLLTAMYSTYGERKIAGFFQDRLGPDRAGPWGILQPLADGGKLFFKEEIIPTNASMGLFIAGPSLAMLTACMSSAVIPWGTYLDIMGSRVDLQVADINIGLLYIFGVVSLGVYGIMFFANCEWTYVIVDDYFPFQYGTDNYFSKSNRYKYN